MPTKYRASISRDDLDALRVAPRVGVSSYTPPPSGRPARYWLTIAVWLFDLWLLGVLTGVLLIVQWWR